MPAKLFPSLAAYVVGVQAELGAIPSERRPELEQLSRFVSECVSRGEPARLVFICTHNSRRSHLAQIWAQTAAEVVGVPGVETYSGGTEATAFNPRAVAALNRAGFHTESLGASENPVVLVRTGPGARPMECFSKVYSRPPNPSEGFCAVMTCSAADAACPAVAGASQRLTISYDDPKAFDGTEEEAAKYDERCRQIAGEMLQAFTMISAV